MSGVGRWMGVVRVVFGCVYEMCMIASAFSCRDDVGIRTIRAWSVR